MTSFQNFPILGLGYSSLIAPISLSKLKKRSYNSNKRPERPYPALRKDRRCQKASASDLPKF